MYYGCMNTQNEAQLKELTTEKLVMLQTKYVDDYNFYRSTVKMARQNADVNDPQVAAAIEETNALLLVLRDDLNLITRVLDEREGTDRTDG